MNKNLLGIDVECFWADKSTGLAVPAKDILASDSKARTVFKEIGTDISPEGYPSFEVPCGPSTLTEDGLAMEVTATPGRTAEDVVANVRVGILRALELATIHGHELVAKPYIYLNRTDLADHPELRVLGCNPDHCVYNEWGEERPHQDARETNWRTGGFHIHFSVNGIQKDLLQAQTLVSWCDAILGTMDVLFEHSELGLLRRRMYGAAGKYRLQPWGVEYRTPSNAAYVSPKFSLALFHAAQLLHRMFERGPVDDLTLWDLVNQREVIWAINQVDVNSAFNIYDKVATYLFEQNLGGDQRLYFPMEVAEKGGVVGFEPEYSMRGWQ